MPSKILAKLFWVFAFLCFLLIVQVDNEKRVASPTNEELDDFIEKDSNHNKKDFPRFYSAYIEVVNTTNDDQKITAVNKALKAAKEEGFSNKELLQHLNLIAGDIHYSRWHIPFALDNYTRAQSYIYNQKIDQKIEQLKKHLSHYDKERDLFEDYIATKYSGPAKTLTGKILVAYVFVDDGIKTRWSNKTRQRSLQTLSLVQEWKKDKAKDYEINNIQFINKSFIARKNPMLKSPKLVSFKSSTKEIEQFVTSVANSLGANSIGEFVEDLVIKNDADQGVVILHTNVDERSFARRCGFTHKRQVFRQGKYQTHYFSQCKDEYIVLMEQVKRNRWDKMHYAQAHEIMHVFGAADLYNIKRARNYSVADIMNYQSKNLTHSRVGPITAYAIGWTDEKPDTPFKVLER